MTRSLLKVAAKVATKEWRHENHESCMKRLKTSDFGRGSNFQFSSERCESFSSRIKKKHVSLVVYRLACEHFNDLRNLDVLIHMFSRFYNPVRLFFPVCDDAPRVITTWKKQIWSPSPNPTKTHKEHLCRWSGTFSGSPAWWVVGHGDGFISHT